MLKFVIIFALFLQYFWEQFLVYLNVRFIEQRERQFPDILPEVLKNRFTAYDCRKALLYSKAKASFGRITGAFSTLIIAFVIGFSMPGLLDQLVGNFPFRRVSFCIIVLFIVQFLAIPFQVYADFVIEQRFGFNKMTLRTFVIDPFSLKLDRSMGDLPVLAFQQSRYCFYSGAFPCTVCTQ